MGGELEIKRDGLVSIIENDGITNVIKPLVKEIFLFDSYVAGTSYVEREIIKSLNVGEKLILRREKDNKFDDRAILLLNEAKQKVGYVPERDNSIFSRLMDAGKLLTAKIIKIDWKDDFSKIKISIFLVDF